MKILQKLIRIIRRYKLEKVFTPSSIARLTYVKRETIETDIDKYLDTPGMQIVLYGHSGCGKSTLIYNKLASKKINYISTSCSSTTTFNELVFQAFDKLDVYYVSEKSISNKYTIQTDLKAKFLQAKSSISQSISKEDSTKSVRVLPIQINSERLAEFLGSIDCVWVIEDFHKVSDKEKKKIADVLKIFIDSSKDFPKVKIICIGAVGTARELIELDSNLQSRVAEMYIPLLSNNEIHKIIKTGFDLMNVVYTDEIENKIIHYSNNLAAVCHQLCYDICYKRNIIKSLIIQQNIGNDDFNNAIYAYVRKNYDTYTKIFDGIATKNNKMTILEGFIKSQKDSITFQELIRETRKIKTIKEETFLNSINELISIECKEILRFDANSKKYSFSTPFLHAFLKMKLAIEEAEKVEQKRKKNKNNEIVLSTNTDIYYDKYFQEMIKDLNYIYSRRINFEKRKASNYREMTNLKSREEEVLLKKINRHR